MAGVPLFPLTAADHHAAKVFVCASVPLMALSLATLVGRLALKARASLRFRWDDYLLVGGFVFNTVNWAVLLGNISYYLPTSRTAITMSNLEDTIETGVIAIPFWAVSITCIKVSVAVQLLRFQQTKHWRVVLYTVIGIVTSTSITWLLINVFQCIPLSATWDTTLVGAKCIDHNTFSKLSRAQSGVSIATDIILSLFPLTFLYQLRRPISEKLLIHVLMAMGMTASAASITKTVLVSQWAHNVDAFKIGFAISLWTCVETFVGIIAACLPSFKSTFQALLARMGIDFSFSGVYSFPRYLSNGPVVVIPRHKNISPSDENSDSSKSSGTLGKAKSASEGYEELEELPTKGSRKEKSHLVSTV